MITETTNPDAAAGLARWWWPGQWLRIVWSVWVDQKWYWRHVYPQLEERRRGWQVFAQAWLGAMLIAVCLLAILPFNTTELGIGDIIPTWMALVSLGVVLGLITLVCLLHNLLGGAKTAIPWTSIMVPVIVMSLFILAYFRPDSGPEMWGRYGAFCLLIGFAGGIFWGVSQGRVTRTEIVTTMLVTFLIATGETRDVTSFLERLLLYLSKMAVTVLVGGAAAYAGGRWATRDLPEEIAAQLPASTSHTSSS